MNDALFCVEKIAHAKINLYLHVVGKRLDGYHLLDSLFCFTEYGDKIKVSPSDNLSLSIDGEFASSLDSSGNNLVLKAANKLKTFLGTSKGAKITLTKNLPISSGIGGGSADAAATLKALIELWKKDISKNDLDSIALGLGADVPACLRNYPIRVSGIGEIIEKSSKIPTLCIILVNPLKALSTPLVFKNREPKFSKPMPIKTNFNDVKAFVQEVSARKNDLENSAIALESSIKDVMEAISSTNDCLLSRMSGSGSTCFGLYENFEAAKTAQTQILKTNSNWWTASSRLICE